MRCPNCGYENPEGRRYCEECGERITNIEAIKARARRKSQREAARIRREAKEVAQEKGLDVKEAERRMRRTRRRVAPWMGLVILGVMIILVVVLIVVLQPGGKSGPEKAVIDFYQAIADKDMMTYLKYTEPELYKMAKNGEYQPDPVTEGLTYDSYRLEELDTRLVSEEGDQAGVEVISGYLEGFNSDGSGSGGVNFSEYPRTISLVEVEGTWIIRDYGIMKLPYPLPEILPEESEFPEVQEEQPAETEEPS
ncbi:MAG: zinc ribbon domain-containing protein [Actinomycetota bacterium]|nr:zinc ribbon domain-containing protein [Actinomycetota bacterium]